MIIQKEIEELVRLKGETLFHREGQELEFKEQFSLSALAEYFINFAAFANNKGGYLIFGIKDSPRTRTGLSEKSITQFEKTDPEKITGYLQDIFSSNISWEMAMVEIGGVSLGVFKIYEAATKPIIATKNIDPIKNGEIFFRYGGRTQLIQSAELENIISKRVEQNNQQWLDLMSKIGKAGPQNAAILDAERSVIEKGDAQILVIDEELAKKLKFVQEGKFVENDGAETLKLIGDVVPVDKIEVIRRVKENLTKLYPLSAIELVKEIQNINPSAKQHEIWKVISDNNLKNNTDYSAYNFRNKKQEDAYSEKGFLASNVPSIYNDNAVVFINKILSNEFK